MQHNINSNSLKKKLPIILKEFSLLPVAYNSQKNASIIYGPTRHPVHPSMLKLIKPCMIGMFWQPHRISFLWVHNLTHNDCEVHCNMIIFMLCYWWWIIVTYNEFWKPLRWDQALYKDQTSSPQCGLSLEVFIVYGHNHRALQVLHYFSDNVLPGYRASYSIVS